MTRAVVVGVGAVGSRAARQLSSSGDLASLAVVDRDSARAALVAEALGSPAVARPWSTQVVREADVVVLAGPRDIRLLAEEALSEGAHVISADDGEDAARELLALDTEARERQRIVAVGAGFSPGLSCVLARHAASLFDRVEDVRVARSGTGGPVCADGRQRALRGSAPDWRRGAWVPAAGGRELCWFPEPVGGRDCVPAHLPDALLLAPAFPDASVVTARTATTWRDRVGPLSRLTRSRPEGLIGALRVEVRGMRDGRWETVVLGAVDRPAVAAGTVAGMAALWAARGRLARWGAAGLGELVDQPPGFLRALAERGVRAASFEPAGGDHGPPVGAPS